LSCLWRETYTVACHIVEILRNGLFNII
jgi:hypothetical protein